MKNLFAMFWVLIEYMVLRPVLAPARLSKQTNEPLQSMRQYFLSTPRPSLSSLPPTQADPRARYTSNDKSASPQTAGRDVRAPAQSA